MEHRRFTLDTNIVLYHFKGNPGSIRLLSGRGSMEIYVSIITKTELLSYPDISDEETRGLNGFLGEVGVVPYTDAIVSLAIEFRKKTRRKIPDSIIAATAIYCDTPLVTCDKDLAAAIFPGFRTIVPELQPPSIQSSL